MDRKTVTLLSFFLWKIVIRDKKIYVFVGKYECIEKGTKNKGGGYELENREMD